MTSAETSTWPPKMAVCVGAVILQGEKVLFIRQAPGHSLAGQWSIPWGLVDEGVTPEDAAATELCIQMSDEIIQEPSSLISGSLLSPMG